MSQALKNDKRFGKHFWERQNTSEEVGVQVLSTRPGWSGGFGLARSEQYGGKNSQGLGLTVSSSVFSSSVLSLVKDVCCLWKLLTGCPAVPSYFRG